MTNYNGRRPADLPEAVAEALARHDDIRGRLRQAERDHRALTDEARDKAAERADRTAAADAAAAGKAVPGAKAAEKLRTDREKAGATVAALRDALDAAVQAVTSARHEAAEAGAEAEKQRRHEAGIALAVAAEDLADLIEREHADRARHEWLRTGVMPQQRAEVHASAAAPILLSRGVGPDDDRYRDAFTPAGDIIRNTVAAAFGPEES